MMLYSVTMKQIFNFYCRFTPGERQRVYRPKISDDRGYGIDHDANL